MKEKMREFQKLADESKVDFFLECRYVGEYDRCPNMVLTVWDREEGREFCQSDAWDMLDGLLDQATEWIRKINLDSFKF